MSHHVFVLHPFGLSQEQNLSPTGNDWEHQQEMAPIKLSLARRVPQSHSSHRDRHALTERADVRPFHICISA